MDMLLKVVGGIVIALFAIYGLVTYLNDRPDVIGGVRGAIYDSRDGYRPSRHRDNVPPGWEVVR